jgi:hypothetical protein
MLPDGAIVVKVVEVDFEGNGMRNLAISYAIGDAPRHHESAPMDLNAAATRLRVLRPAGPGAWTVAFDDAVAEDKAGDSLDIQKIRSASGREGLVELTHATNSSAVPSGISAPASWSVVAEDGGRFVVLDPGLILDKAFREEGYTDHASSIAKVERDAVVETQAGPRRSAAMCCRERPPFVISVRFTGTSLTLGSVRWLLFARNGTAPHGM